MVLLHQDGACPSYEVERLLPAAARRRTYWAEKDETPRKQSGKRRGGELSLDMGQLSATLG